MDAAAENRPRPMLEALNSERIRDLWSKTYNTEGKPDWSHIFPYYHDDIIFEDSIQRVEGKKEFMAMCSRLAQRCEKINMEILGIVEGDHQIFFQWRMAISYKRWPNTALNGCTYITMADDNRINTQRDYFDLWGTILNGIPLLRKSYWNFMHRYFG